MDRAKDKVVNAPKIVLKGCIGNSVLEYLILLNIDELINKCKSIISVCIQFGMM